MSLNKLLFFTNCRQRSLRRRGGPRREMTKVTVFALLRFLNIFLCSLFLCWWTSNISHSPFCSALRPPVPPAFCPAFSSIVRLLCCDIMVHVLRCVLQRAAEDRATHWTEAIIQRVPLHFYLCTVFSYGNVSALPCCLSPRWHLAKHSNTPTSQALHLIGEALIEEKTQLQDSTVEEVTFDFSLKARSEFNYFYSSQRIYKFCFI